MKRVVVLVAIGAVALAQHPWRCFHGDPQHTGRSPYAVGAWFTRTSAYNVGEQVSGSPVVRDDGCVLVGARDVRLHCFDPALTYQLWVADLTAHGSNIYFSAPALDDSGNAYITTNRKLVKVSRSGSFLWAWPNHNLLSISHSPVVGPDGKVYFACYSDSLYALNPDGSLTWARDLGADVNSAPAVGPDGRIYAATTRGSGNWKLWCFDQSGASPWTYDLADEADFASPAIGPDTTIYVGAGRYLYAVRPNGTLGWRDSLSAMIQSCPAVANESTLYVVAGSWLYCIDADSSVRWRVSIGGSNYCSPAVDAEGYVFVGSASLANSAFYCIGPDATVLDTYRLGAEVWSSPAIGVGRKLYFGTMGDSLYLFMGVGGGVGDAPSQPVLAEPCIAGIVRGFLPLPAGVFDARLYDASGRCVPVQRVGSALVLDRMRSGLYFVTYQALGRQRSHKVVVR